FSDVLLPIAPWTETPGTFVNAEGRVQSFHAVVKPLGEARPAWKVLRVLANLLGLPGFTYESAQEVLVAARGEADAGQDLVQGDRLHPDPPGPEPRRPVRPADADRRRAEVADQGNHPADGRQQGPVPARADHDHHAGARRLGGDSVRSRDGAVEHQRRPAVPD